MDLEEWDLLSDEGLIDLHENEGNNKINNNISPKSIPNTTLIDMNYFQKFSDPPKKTGVVIPVPIQLGSNNNNQQDDQKTEEKIPEEEVLKFPIEETPKTEEYDHFNNQEIVSQVFFKKLEKNEFVDMKMDSPKSLTNCSNNGKLLPQPDVEFYRFNEKAEVDEEDQILKNDEMISKNLVDGDQSTEEGLNIWKLAMTGIGALFSFGFAAATVSIIVLGNRHKESCRDSKKKELHYQIYSHDKRLNQVVRHATKLNEAITTMRGASVTRAHITTGGYHQSL